MNTTPTATEPKIPQVDELGLAAFLATQTDVWVAYLFGSLAQGRATSGSDVDIAILLADASDPLAVAQRRLRLLAALEPFVSGQLDVVILNQASSVLQHEVLRHRHILYQRDPSIRADFEVRANQVYTDEAPLREYFAQVMFDEIREGRFGGSRYRRS
jgi:predicted nucleotidyltransferase